MYSYRWDGHTGPASSGGMSTRHSRKQRESWDIKSKGKPSRNQRSPSMPTSHTPLWMKSPLLVYSPQTFFPLTVNMSCWKANIWMSCRAKSCSKHSKDAWVVSLSLSWDLGGCAIQSHGLLQCLICKTVLWTTGRWLEDYPFLDCIFICD